MLTVTSIKYLNFTFLENPMVPFNTSDISKGCTKYVIAIFFVPRKITFSNKQSLQYLYLAHRSFENESSSSLFVKIHAILMEK